MYRFRIVKDWIPSKTGEFIGYGFYPEQEKIGFLGRRYWRRHYPESKTLEDAEERIERLKDAYEFRATGPEVIWSD